MKKSFLNVRIAEETSLINIKSIIANILIDLRYATPDNFTGQTMYEFQECFLQKEVALQLAEVQKELESMGLGLKIWDGFRPMAVQWKFWELLPDERYVSDPRKGGRHTRGTAVDVTLVNQKGEELGMPSGFDDFSEKAHRDFQGASESAIWNRAVLERVMQKHGFVGLPSEWWHFDFVGWEKYPPIEIL